MDEELKIKLEIRHGGQVKKKVWKEYAHAFINISDIFDALAGEIERTLPFLRRR